MSQQQQEPAQEVRQSQATNAPAPYGMFQNMAQDAEGNVIVSVAIGNVFGFNIAISKENFMRFVTEYLKDHATKLKYRT